MLTSDTISAIATPPGEGGVGIVRVSGPRAFEIADALFVTRSGAASSLPSHTLHYGAVRDPQRNETVDDALLLVFRAPHSYTGENVVELHCHGGPVTLGRVLRLTLQHGARSAEPGEFTQRAFMNGRMDLAQAEAVCDLIRAKTEQAQRMAVRQRAGVLSQRIARIKEGLVGALAAIEVTIDFSDEVGDLDYSQMADRLSGIHAEIEALSATAQRGRVYREGIRVAIVGRPNVGKSSLLNALLGDNRAIVTPIAGTTRDVIEETANVRGIPLTAIDTAGLRDTADTVERIGVERAHAAIDTASLLLFVLDASTGWTDADAQIADRIAGRRAVWVANKIDLALDPEACAAMEVWAQGARLIPVSAHTGEGMDGLEAAIADTILGGQIDAGEGAVVTNARHLVALEAARDSLSEALRTTADGMPPDFISIDVRAALDELGRITGETATEDIIHRIFHDFCVGK